MKKALPYLFAALLLGSCGTIHEFPDGDVNEGMMVVNLDLEIDMNYEGEITRQTYAAYAAMLEGGYDIRYTVEIYRDPGNPNAELTELAARIVRTSGTVAAGETVKITERLWVAAAKYKALVWVDFVAKGSSGDLNYDTEKLTAISIIRPGGVGRGYDMTKDAFCGSVEMDFRNFCEVHFTDYTVTCPTRRPLALYRIITTDMEEYAAAKRMQPFSYASVRPGTTDLRYRDFFPGGYSIQFDKPDRFRQGAGYSFDIEDPGGGKESIIASDFVLVHPEDVYAVDFDIRDAGGNLIRSVENMRLTLKRNMITIIRDKFLTTENSGGIGIDDEFEDEIIIEL